MINDINEINDTNDVFGNNNNDKGSLISNSELSTDTSSVSNDLSPTSPEDKNVIENINERISRLIDPEDTKIELYNAARIKGIIKIKYNINM